MSKACEICGWYHKHDVIAHILEIEAHLEVLIARLDELEDKLK